MKCHHFTNCDTLLKRNKLRSFLVWAALFQMLALTSLLPAQNTQIQSQEIQKQATPNLRSDGTAPPLLGEEDDFGPLEVVKRTKSWFITPFAAATGFWTSNVLLTNAAEKGDSVWVQTEGLDAGYRITSDWEIQAGYSYARTRYSENPILDTDGHSVNFGTTYKLPWNFQLGTGIRGTWLDAPHQKSQIYRENDPYASLMQTWSFFDDRLAVFYGYEYDHKFAHPIGFDDHEHTVFGGLAYGWLPNLFTQVALRQNWQFYDFRESTNLVNGRQEWVSSATLQTVWEPLSWLQVSAFGVATYDNSVNATFDYKSANVGGEIRAFWKF